MDWKKIVGAARGVMLVAFLSGGRVAQAKVYMNFPIGGGITPYGYYPAMPFLQPVVSVEMKDDNAVPLFALGTMSSMINAAMWASAMDKVKEEKQKQPASKKRTKVDSLNSLAGELMKKKPSGVEISISGNSVEVSSKSTGTPPTVVLYNVEIDPFSIHGTVKLKNVIVAIAGSKILGGKSGIEKLKSIFKNEGTAALVIDKDTLEKSM